MRILSILAQKPYATGSGVYATELIRQWEAQGHEQALICGVDNEEPLLIEYQKQFEKLKIFPVRFNTKELPFPPMGMSDVMPYPSTRYRDLAEEQAGRLESAFSKAIAQAVEQFRPERIVCHHLYFVTTLVVEQTDLPIAAICHGTCLRQLATHDFERERILHALPKISRIFALQEVQKQEIFSLGVDKNRVEVVGNGYNPEIFHQRRGEASPDEANNSAQRQGDINRGETKPKRPVKLAYAGKISRSKGLFSLLRAVDTIQSEELELYLAGSASDGAEYTEIAELAKQNRHTVHFLGQLTQEQLSELYARCDLFVFPSYYEGLGLAVIEAMACGLRIVVSNTEGLQDWIRASVDNPPVVFVDLPTMLDVDVPAEDELPRYEKTFAKGIEKQIALLEQSDFQKTILDMSVLSWGRIAQKILSASHDMSER